MITSEISFRPMAADDWESVAEIYKQGIDGGNATFELEVPTWEEWDKVHLKTCRIVAEKDNEIVGWVALSAVLGRKLQDNSLLVKERAPKRTHIADKDEDKK